MKRINYKSNFDFIAKLTATNANGESVEVGFPDYDFELIITSGCNGYSTRSFVASSIGGATKNCFNDNGQLHIVCDNHKLNVGELFGEFKAYLPNDIYPDGTQLNVEPQSLRIELVVGASDTPTTAEIELQLPYIYQSAYDLAVASGYEGSMEDYLRLSAELPEAVETAKLVKLSADSLANSASSLSESATKVSEGANTIKECADALQENVDKVSESASAVEQASESLDATKQAFEMLSSEWTDGRQAIATALTNRRYPTEPTESFHSMADKITNMSYEEGWFAKIGYTDENDGGIKEAIDYSYELAKAWKPDESTRLIFRGNKKLVFAPWVDTRELIKTNSMYEGCDALVAVPTLDFPKATNCSRLFMDCKYLLKAFPLVNGIITNFNYTFHSCLLLNSVFLDFSNALYATFIFQGCSSLTYIYISNLGKSTLATYDFSGASVWGTGGEENRQSLINSLITYSYDRASNGMATATIKLSATTKALLTEEEIAQITNKGFTIS